MKVHVKGHYVKPYTKEIHCLVVGTFPQFSQGVKLGI